MINSTRRPIWARP
ncbi:hypothetical protein QTP70_015628 [Hemibagrus guttatus]|uniref:Uncharacterized protein n=1 Tax=Hemibagrus guttatus TaxID=175788 RepID=A0AAE0Q2H8_9TELE|nr:hypothetical protein QTP70_015628 [Hemibagrus guttatus]